MIKLLLLFGFHNWEYSSKQIIEGTTRICKWSGKIQLYINEGPVGRWGGDLSHWVDIGNSRELNLSVPTNIPLEQRVKLAPYSAWIPIASFTGLNAAGKYKQFGEITFQNIQGVKYKIHRIYTDTGTWETVSV
jgi:hypothetical protein